MSSLARMALRRQMASCSSSSLIPRVRRLHASQPLDPTPDNAPPPLSNAASNIGASTSAAPMGAANASSGTSSMFASDIGQRARDLEEEAYDEQDRGDFVHVRLAYLHSSTKEPPAVIRAGNQKTGRIQPDPQYVPLSPHVFNADTRRDIIHSSVVYTLDGRRQGTASTKTRGEVAYSGRKMRPQKGTGKSRMGDRGSPILRGGGVAHGPKPRDMSSKLNRRVRELATRSVISLRWKTGDLHVVKDLHWDTPPHSTKPLARLLNSRQWSDVLFLTAPREPSEQDFSIYVSKKPSVSDPVYTEQQIKEHAAYIKPFLSSIRNVPRADVIQLHTLAEEAAAKTRVKPGFSRKQGDLKKPAELHAYDILKRKTLVCDLGAIEWLEEKYGGALTHGIDIEILGEDETWEEKQERRWLAEQSVIEDIENGDSEVDDAIELGEVAASDEARNEDAAVQQELEQQEAEAQAEQDAIAAEEERVMNKLDESTKQVEEATKRS